MNKIYMMVGIQGSGKSTLSNILKKKLNIEVVSSDAIRSEFPSLDESLVFPTVYKRIYENIKNNKDSIFDATSITPGARMNLFNQLNTLGLENQDYQVICVYFIPNLEKSKERVMKRNMDKNERYLPVEVIDKYYSSIIEPKMEEGFSKIIYINCDDDLEKISEEMF